MGYSCRLGIVLAVSLILFVPAGITLMTQGSHVTSLLEFYCTDCGYPMPDTNQDACPECGIKRSESKTRTYYEELTTNQSP